MCTKNEALIILDEAYKKISSLTAGSVVESFLYGSFARGDFTLQSDVDLFFTLNMTEKQIAELRKKISAVSSELSLKHNVTVSISVKPHDRFVRFSEVLPYYKNIISEGIRYAG